MTGLEREPPAIVAAVACAGAALGAYSSCGAPVGTAIGQRLGCAIAAGCQPSIIVVGQNVLVPSGFLHCGRTITATEGVDNRIRAAGYVARIGLAGTSGNRRICIIPCVRGAVGLRFRPRFAAASAVHVKERIVRQRFISKGCKSKRHEHHSAQSK